MDQLNSSRRLFQMAREAGRIGIGGEDRGVGAELAEFAMLDLALKQKQMPNPSHFGKAEPHGSDSE